MRAQAPCCGVSHPRVSCASSGLGQPLKILPLENERTATLARVRAAYTHTKYIYRP